MTTAGMWWADTLESFSEAFAIRYDLVQENHPAVREIGEWWQKGDGWCVQLDSWSHVHFLDEVSSKAGRRMLTIALRNASAASARQLSWRQVVTRHFSELIHRSLTDSWPLQSNAHKLGLRLTTRELKTPGRFAWLEFSGKPSDGEDFRQMVQQVVEASADIVFVGWTDHPASAQAALVFLQEIEGNTDEVDWDPDESANSTEEEVVESGSGYVKSSAGRSLRPLLDSLESDAMVPVKATIGAEVTDIHDWASGLHTLAEAWRERTWFAPGQSLYVWGQQPVAYLLSSLTSEQMAPFLRMAENGASGDILLSADLAETLQGVLAANLNISEASRLLYLHRNTLMNRIDRIHSQTGYDIRQFEDALILWMAQVLLRRRRDTADSEMGV